MAGWLGGVAVPEPGVPLFIEAKNYPRPPCCAATSRSGTPEETSATVQVDRDGNQARRGCGCPCCRVEAIVYLLEAGWDCETVPVKGILFSLLPSIDIPD